MTIKLSVVFAALLCTASGIPVDRIMVDESHQFPWLSFGKLIESVPRYQGPAKLLFDRQLIFATPAGIQTVINNDVSMMTSVITQQRLGGGISGMILFIKNDLTKFLYYSMMTKKDEFVLDTKYLRYYRDESKTMEAMGADKHAIEKSISILKRDYGLQKIELQDGVWKIFIPVVNGNGSVSLWAATGGVNPFTIRNAAKSTVEEKNSILVPPISN